MGRTNLLAGAVLGLALFGATTIALPGAAAPGDGLRSGDRVACARAVAEVYWEQRIWPASNPGPKPSLDSVLSEPRLKERAERVVRLSSLLDRWWSRPVTSAALESEIRRIFSSTRRPEVLEAIVEALDRDPHRIAECLARPILVERLGRTYYARDERIHAELAARAEAELASLPGAVGIATVGDDYRETWWIADEGPRATPEPIDDGRERRLVSTERLAELTRSLSPGAPGALVEHDDRFETRVILEVEPDRALVATVEWRKPSLDEWVAAATTDADLALTVAPEDHEGFVLPSISTESAGEADSWRPTSVIPEGLSANSAVWTGSEMIVWGGGKRNTGARYDPATDTWTGTSVTGAPSPRSEHVAVWTGTQMIVWGGCGQSSNFCEVSSGGRYDPTTDTWTPTAGGGPAARKRHTAVWTGSEMIVFGGCRTGSFGNNACEIELGDGGRYDPATNSWTGVPSAGGPSDREFHTAVWTGSEMIVWGGRKDGSTISNGGGRYDPSTNGWTATTAVGAPAARANHSAVWAAGEMIVWGGCPNTLCLVNDQPHGDGARYDPASDTWTPVSDLGAPAARDDHTAVWTGSEMIVWGGTDASLAQLDTGGRYDPLTDSWNALATTNAPEARSHHLAVWTGSEMIVWGQERVGGRYDPASGSWAPTSDNAPVKARSKHVTVFSGAEMLIWGGDYVPGGSAPGERYDLVTDSWSPMTQVGAPFNREHGASAVWTGSEMIVWGGQSGTVLYNTGGRYDPVNDTWQPVATLGAPVERGYLVMVWSGSQMIVWGGNVYSGATGEGMATSSGARYDPLEDRWFNLSSTGAPSARRYASGAWTGSKLIVWGGLGSDPSVDVDTGGVYDPAANAWSGMSATGAPSPRHFHTAVWTGSEMIVWGGMEGFLSGGTYLNTGGIYDLATDGWTAMTDVGAPEPRIWHAGVWAADELIVWGGCSGSTSCPNGYATGGRYDPSLDSWSTTSSISAPGRRDNLSGVWTGSEMFIWGGYNDDYGSFTMTGALYTPDAALFPPSEVSPPGSLQPLEFSSATTLRWEAGAASGAVTFNLYRGDVATFLTSMNTACHQPDLPSSTAAEAATPSAGAGWYYLVTGENGAGEGPPGTGSDDGTRPVVSPCP